MSKSSQPQTVPPSSRSQADLRPEERPEEPEEEVRCYHFPSIAIECERKLLAEQDVEDFRGLLCHVSWSLSGLASLLELTGEETPIDSALLYLLKQEIKRTDKLAFHIQDAYSLVELVEA